MLRRLIRICKILPLLACASLLPEAFSQVSVLAPDALERANLLQPDSTYATRSTLNVTGQPFTRAVRVNVRKKSANPWEIQLNLQNPKAIAANDTLHAIFYLRTATNRSAMTEFVFEKSSPNYDQSANRVVTEDQGDWTKVQVAFKSVASYAPGASQINFRLGYTTQTLDLAGLTLTNYGTTKQPSDFPIDITYPGQSPTAPWRAAAAERIEQIRKADLTVRLKDSTGAPLPNAPVRICQKEHAFSFGTAVSAARLLNSSSTRAPYQGVITQLFNRVVLENDLKWPNWESNPALARNAVDWFNARNIPVRGHNLIWPAWRWMPADTQSLSNNPAALRDRINRHFTNELSAVAGKILEWDVINEPWTEKDVMKVLGDSEMIQWLKIAKALDPTARLFVNDYGNVEVAGLTDTHAEGFYQILKYLLNGGAPVEGIGLQGHFKEWLSSPDAIFTVLDRFAEFGKPLAITELDVDLSDREVQADYTRDLLTTFFSHPAVESVLFWGFWEGSHWRPNAALFNQDFTMRPNGIAFSNLVYRTWWTDTNAVTDAQGNLTIRAFKGAYDIITTSGTNSLILITNTSLSLTVAPTLNIKKAASGIELTWPADLRLETTTNLSSFAWSELTTATTSNGIARATIDPIDRTRFFRTRSNL